MGTRWLRGVALALLALAHVVAAAQGLGSIHLRPEITQHTAAVRRIATSPDESLIATVGDDKTGRLWRAADRRLLAVLRVPIGPAQIGRLYGVAFSPDGRSVAVAGTHGPPTAPHRIDVFDATNGNHLRTLPLDAGNVVRLLWTRDGRHLAACLSGQHGLRILTAQGRTVLSESYNGACYALAQRPDGTLLQGGLDGVIREYKAAGDSWALSRKIPVDGAEPLSIAVSPDGAHFAVGYRSPISAGRIAVDVFDAARGTLARRFWFTDQRYGSLGSVAWSRDGRTLAASGRASNDDGGRVQVVMKRISWPGAQVQSDFVATDTIQDMAPIGPDRFAVASSNGSWAVLSASGPIAPLGSTVLDLRGADTLKASADLHTVAFGGEAWSGASTFRLRTRELATGDDPGLEPSRRSSSAMALARWKNHPRPEVSGRPVSMSPVELSRSAALLPDDAGALLGTTHTLRRFDREGRPLWSVPTAAEVTSLTVSHDGRVVLGTLNDGTVRWWRAQDGALLLSLLATPDRRWVLWTEQGYYDASPGAEPLLGWHLNREGGAGVDFFSVGRYRDTYHRPDVIDRVLDTLDPDRARASADEQRKAYVDAGATALTTPAPAPSPPPPASPPVVVQAPAAPPAPAVSPAAAAPPVPASAAPAAVATLPTPPQVLVTTERSVVSASRMMRIDFSLRAGSEPADAMIVRLDGRPVQPATLTMPTHQDGLEMGSMTVPMPERSAEVALMARAGFLHSEPVRLSWIWVSPSKRVAGAGKTTAVVPAPAPAPPPLPADVEYLQTELNTPPAAPVPNAAVPAAGAARVAQGSHLYVLAVGVSKYARPEYSLDLAAKDATDFAAVFSGEAGRIYSRIDTRLLTDREATRDAVLSGLEWLRQSAGPDDTVILFIAGHGVNDARGRYYFLPHDADVDRLGRTGIGEAEIRSTLSAVRGRAMLFADTCYAGNVIGTGRAASAEIGRLANTLSSAENGVIVFSASTGRQKSIESDRWGNGAFTKALLSGLKGQADFRKDGVVTHQGLSYYLGREVAALTRGRQTPVTAVPIGVVDFPLIAAARTP